MKQAILVLLLLGLISILAAFPVRIISWKITDDIKELNAMHVSIDDVNRETQTIIVWVSHESDYETLLAHGFNAERIPATDPRFAAGSEPGAKNDNSRNYLSYADYVTFMQTTAANYPNICQLVQFGTSEQNRALYFLKISDNVTVDENEPEFRYISSIHGNEPLGFDMCVRLIQQLTSEYGTNQRITNIVNSTEIWICPLLNVDGYVLQQRGNANGVDMNRNFPLPDGTLHPDGEAYQAATQAVMANGNSRRFVLSANFHTGALVVNYPWDYISQLAPDNSILVQSSLAYASHNPPMHNSTEFPQGITNGYAWYQALGSLQDWSYAYTGDFDATIELSNTSWPANSELDTYWANNQESMLSYMEYVQLGLNGTVTNSSGAPLDATIHLSTPGMDIRTDPAVGDYHRLLLSGNYTVTASATGYLPQTVDVTIPLSGMATHNFVLGQAQVVDFSGKVINQNGDLISNAAIKLTQGTDIHQTTSDADGHFQIDTIPAGNYTLNVTATGYGSFQQILQLRADNQIQNIILNQPLFFDSFENGLTNWTAQSPWAIITQGANHVVTDSPTGNYSTNLRLNLTLTNAIPLINVSNPILTFKNSYALESGYDFLNVQVSTNGTTWTTVAQYTGTVSLWTSQTINLAAYIGTTFHLRFQLYSDSSINADGAYIDDVMISGLPTQQTVFGDIDGDWLMSMNDAQDVLEYTVGNDPLPTLDPIPWETYRFDAADVNANNQIDPTDAYIISQKVLDYNGAFPAQGGTAYSFSNPNLAIQCLNGQIHVMADNPENLKAFKLQFSSTHGVTTQAPQWQFATGQCLTSEGNADGHSYSCAKIGTNPLPSTLLLIPFTTTDDIINCTGWANDIPFTLNIGTTANNDQTVIPVTALYANYPNPFNPVTTIRFSIAQGNSPTRLDIYNLKGQKVRTLINSVLPEGIHSLVWNGTDDNGNTLGSGVYYYRLQTPKSTFTHRMVMVK